MFGLIRSSKHRQIYVKQAEAYRWEIDQARAEARAARRQLQDFLDSLAPDIYLDKGFDSPGLRIMIELDHRLLEKGPHSQELLFLLHHRLMDRLMSVNLPDVRGDMRQTEQERRFDSLRAMGSSAYA